MGDIVTGCQLTLYLKESEELDLSKMSYKRDFKQAQVVNGHCFISFFKPIFVGK